MQTPVGVEQQTGEGCGRVLLALVLGMVSFFAVFWLGGMLAYSGIAAPNAALFVAAAGAGAAVAAICVCVTPRRRWAVAVPVLVILELLIFSFGLLMGAYDYRPPSGLLIGAFAGIFAGFVVLTLVKSDQPLSARLRVAGLVIAAVAVGGALPVLFGQFHLARVRRNVLPAIEQLVRADTVPATSPITWKHPEWKLWSDGADSIYASGETSDRRISIRLGTDEPLRGPTRPGTLDGLTVSDLDIAVPSGPLSKALRPEFVARLQKYRSQYGATSYTLTSRYHGMTYLISTNVWDGRDLSQVTCEGTYRSSGP